MAVHLSNDFLILVIIEEQGGREEKGRCSALGTNTIDLQGLQSGTIISVTGMIWRPFVSHL